MATKTYLFKADHVDPPTGLTWRAGVADRVADTDIQSRLEAATGPAGELVVVDLGANFVSDGDFNVWPLPAAVKTLLAQSSQANMRTTGLGGGAVGAAAFTAADAAAFQGLSGQRIFSGNIAQEGVAVIPLSVAAEWIPLVLSGNGGIGVRLLSWRSGQMPVSLAAANVSPPTNFSVAVLTGTTGAAGAVTISANTNGNLYVENRWSGTAVLAVHALRRVM